MAVIEPKPLQKDFELEEAMNSTHHSQPGKRLQESLNNQAKAEINELKVEIKAQQEFITRLKRQLTADQSQESET